ncbi:MAG: VWA domain-containing protein [Kiritimatiellae bacterium]|nr:VWA domain-containing protein [Kiritimatiellia bacterium]
MKVTLDAPPPPAKTQRPPVNLAIVLDRSGSMQGAKLEKAKEAAIGALRRLGPRDICSVVVYDNTVQTIVPAQYARELDTIEAGIRAIQAGGSTALFGGVSQGAAEVRKHLKQDCIPRIILLSDGLANVGPRSPEDLGRLGAALIKEGMSVSTVGVGVDYNEDLMTRLAEKSDGNTYFVESSEDLPRIFAAELGDVLSVVARRVRLTIECPAGVVPVSIIGREGRISGGTVELSLNQLYGGQEKYALVEVEIPEARAGESREIAVARVSYENPFTQRTENADGRVSARFSAGKEEVARSVNGAVQREIYYNGMALSVDNAIALSDQGKVQEAVHELKKNAKDMKEAAARLNDAELQKRAEDLDRQADQLEQEGMTKAGRKQFRAESYQTRNQQMSQ